MQRTKVQRWGFIVGNRDLIHRKEGWWVKYSDYKKLEDETEILKKIRLGI